jgi:pimeloyl-ACP methyl ester carboxylesterase
LVVTSALIEDGRQHMLLDAPIALSCPVRLLQGMEDPDVPWETALSLSRRIEGGNVQVTLIKEGDHRLSRDQDLALLERILVGVIV